MQYGDWIRSWSKIVDYLNGSECEGIEKIVLTSTGIAILEDVNKVRYTIKHSNFSLEDVKKIVFQIKQIKAYHEANKN